MRPYDFTVFVDKVHNDKIIPHVTVDDSNPNWNASLFINSSLESPHETPRITIFLPKQNLKEFATSILEQLGYSVNLQKCEESHD